MRRFSACDLVNQANNFKHLLVNCRPIIFVASVCIVLLAMNLVGTQVKVCSEFPFLKEPLVFFRFFVKDATVKVLVVLILPCVDDCLKLSEGLSVEHLLTKLGEVFNSLLTHLCLKIQEVQDAEVDVFFENPV